MTAPVVVLMGVSGSGKTTVGRALAQRLGCPFYDADDFHPSANVAKMAAGTPLNDDDRRPWLARLQQLLAAHLAAGETAVLACSALKQSYREQLRAGNAALRFIYLHGDMNTIRRRLQARENHYMAAEMLPGQFDTLEEPSPAEAHWISIDGDVDEIVDRIMKKIE